MQSFLGRHWRKLTLAVVCLPIVAFLGLCLVIGVGVRGAVSNAQARFPGDPVLALISVATDEQAGISQRNRSIWALGQLGSANSLPVLQGLATGEQCDHDSLICQKEVLSAIDACSGEGTNIGALIWRHGALAEASNGGGSSP